MVGEKDNKDIFIVDENNNNDFTDDSIRLYKKLNWDDTDPLFKCSYLISNGNKIVKDSSWLRIGESSKRFSLGRSEYLTGEFYIDSEKFKIGIVESINPFSFTYSHDPELALLPELGVKKDSMSEGDILKIGEFLHLNNEYYRFQKITNNGEFVTLVKDKSFKTRVGTQIGMLAPSFNAITVSGDTIISSNLQKKPTIIVNSCGCGGDIESTEAYYKIKNTYHKKFNILHMDSGINKEVNEGIHIDSENKFNIDFYKNYRKTYCSRTCYIIGLDNRIKDKFNVFAWEIVLPKHIQH